MGGCLKRQLRIEIEEGNAFGGMKVEDITLEEECSDDRRCIRADGKVKQLEAIFSEKVTIGDELFHLI